MVLRAEPAVGNDIGLCARWPPPHNATGRSPQVFDQRDAQGDGNGPQFANVERLDLLGAYEAGQRLGIEQGIAGERSVT